MVKHVRSLRRDVLEICVSSSTTPQFERCADARAIVVAAWRPVPTLCELADRVSHKQKRPFIPLVLESQVLRLGPIVLPGKSACWGCWNQRCRQAAGWSKEQDAIFHYYSSSAESGPKGYLEPFAVLGAARLSDSIDALMTSDSLASSVWQIDLITREIVTSVVVGVHGCPCCGLGRCESKRSVDSLQHELHYMWTYDYVQVG